MCDRCGRAGQHRKRNLIAQFGANIALPVCGTRSQGGAVYDKVIQVKVPRRLDH
jgi:hypothetical protein